MADRVTLLWPSARWWCAAWVLGALPVQAPAQHTPATAAPHWQNVLGMPFVRIPAGSFRMGSDESPESLARAYPQLERARFEQLSDEAPVHTVHITRPFYLGQTEVTVGQFRRFVQASGYVPESEADGTGGYGYNPAYDSLTSASGDAFEILGFSSVRRQHVRIQHLKGFDEAWTGAARARVGAIKPGYYTRMGAALRHATARLLQRGEHQCLLIILTDGKPNDLDVYEGRYGLEDTRHAVREARALGLTPFCITIDAKAHDYLPHLFGSQGYALVHRPQDLVRRLASAYAGLTR